MSTTITDRSPRGSVPTLSAPRTDSSTRKTTDNRRIPKQAGRKPQVSVSESHADPESKPNKPPEKQQDILPPAITISEAAEVANSPEQSELEQLLELRATRKRELDAVDDELIVYAMHAKSLNASERADQISKKTEEIRAVNKVMKKDIDLLRHADRVMVSLRDTVDTLKKHLRIRTAHIQQKLATIDLLARRCSEQRLERVQLLDGLESNANVLASLAATELDVEVSLTGVDPLRCASWILCSDASDEEWIEFLIRECAHLEDQNTEATKALNTELRRLSTGIDSATGDTTVIMEQIKNDWDNTKLRMLLEYERLNKMHDEFAYHIRRGSNIKTVEQLPNFPQWSEWFKLSNLGLTLAAVRDEAERSRAQRARKKDDLDKLTEAHRTAVEQSAAAVAGSEQRFGELRKKNEMLRSAFGELHSRFKELAISDPVATLVIRDLKSTSVDAHCTPNRTPRYLSPTSSRRTAIQVNLDEASDRASRQHQMKRRPR